MAFSEPIKIKALVACSRHCCICHKFCGLKIELHHIVHGSEKGDNSFENCIPLCFDCHSEQRSYDHKHPKGTKYSREELVQHRENWYSRVKQSPISGEADLIPLDKSVFDQIKSILRWDGVIGFLRKHDFGNSYPFARIDPIFDYDVKVLDPAFSFFDAELEALKAELEFSIGSFLQLHNKYVFMIDSNPEYLSVPKDWSIKDPQRYDETVDSLNRSANALVANYDALVKSARRKLGD